MIKTQLKLLNKLDKYNGAKTRKLLSHNQFQGIFSVDHREIEVNQINH